MVRHRNNLMADSLFLLISAFLVIALAGLLACSSKSSQQAKAPSDTNESSPGAKSALSGWELEWDNILKGAKKEGRVVIYTGVANEMHQDVARAFRLKYRDIEVEFLAGRTPELVQRHLTQQRAGLFTTDLYAGSGSTTLLTRVKPAEGIIPLENLLILPEVKDPNVWQDGKIPFVDRDRTILYFMAGISPPITVNTRFVKEDEIKSYRDVLEPKWKGKIVMDDPTQPGPGLKWFAVTTAKIMDVDYMKQLGKQEPVLTRDYRLPVEWMANGKYLIGMPVQNTVVRSFQNDGVPFVQIIPVEGVHTTHGVASVAVLKGAPHRNAAILFLNWLLTKEAQLVWSKAEFRQSMRKDVPTDHLDKNSIRQPGVKYFSTDDEDFMLKEPQFTEMAREIFMPSQRR